MISNDEYMNMLKDLVEEGQSLGLMVSGNSMWPFLVHQRDFIYFEKPSRPLQVGDPVFYQRETGQYVMHRIVGVNQDGTYRLLGDHQIAVEEGVEREQIFALVTQVRRKGKLVKPKDWSWKFYATVWMKSMLLRRVIFKIDRILKGSR